MRRAIILVALFGCSADPPPKPPPQAPVVLPPLAVKAVIRRVTDGWLEEDSPFVVILNRPVDEMPGALALIDDSGVNIAGETVWLARQAVAFYPATAVAGGLDLHLRLIAPLHAKDGTSLAPADIVAASTRDLEATAYTPVALIHPTDAIHLAFKNDQPILASEVESLGELSDGSGPVPFVARDAGTFVYVTPKAAFRPGGSFVFGWKGGQVAKTSKGRIHLAPYRGHVGKGLFAYVGDYDDHCDRIKGNDDKNWVCKGDLVHLHFSAPVAKSELKMHVHPQLEPATTGDLRGHRVEVKLGSKPVTIVLDAKLQDVFSQELKYPVTFVIRKAD